MTKEVEEDDTVTMDGLTWWNKYSSIHFDSYGFFPILQQNE